jgi:hypothetical protein
MDRVDSRNKDLQNFYQKRILRFLEIAFISGLVIYSVSILWKSLSVPWIYNSDEVVYTAEVIKMLRLNFNQSFFDIPGTPFMFLTTILWAIWYAILSLSRQIPPDLSIKLFSFQNLDQLYFLMRFLVLFFYGLSIVLTYIVGKRLTNGVGGCVAALFLAWFYPYVVYSSFVRTESMGICLALIALYLVLDAIELNRLQNFFWGGVWSGVATAARYHFVLTALPQLFLFFFLKKKSAESPESESLPRWTAILATMMGALFLFGGILSLLLSLKLITPNWLTDRILISPEDPALPKALSLMRKLWLGLGILALALFIIFRVPKLRPLGRRIVQPPLVLIFTGFGVGLVLGTPTFLWRGSYLLRSIQFYSDWIDYNRLKLSPFGQYLDMVSSYWKIVAPTVGLGLLMVIGTGLILFRRDRNLYPILLGAILAFLAQPVLLPTGPHRVLPWLPYLVMVQAYPFAVLFQLTSKANKRKTLIQFLALCSLLLVSFGFVTNSAKLQLNNTEQIVIPRLAAVNRVSTWLENHTEPNSLILMSYYAFNDQIYYSWMENLGVTLPKVLRRTRLYYPFWGDRTTLVNRSGYVVIGCSSATCKKEVEISKRDWDNKKPGEGVNPFTEPGFTKLTSLSEGNFEMIVFRFDFTSPTHQQKK